MPETTPRLEDTFIRSYRQLAAASPARSRDVILRALDVGFSALLPKSFLYFLTNGAFPF